MPSPFTPPSIPSGSSVAGSPFTPGGVPGAGSAGGAAFLSSPVIFLGTSPEFGPTGLLNSYSPSSYTWDSINDPVAIPFVMPVAGTVVALGWLNGGGAVNADLGIYNTAFARQVSTGSVAKSASGFQWVSVGPTSLNAGQYFLVMSTNSIAANSGAGYTLLSAGHLALMGCQDSATDAFPLPATLTNMAAAATFSHIPYVGIGFTPGWPP